MDAIECATRYRDQQDVDLRYMAIRELCNGPRNSQGRVQQLCELHQQPGALEVVTHDVILRSVTDRQIVRSVVERELLGELGDECVSYVVSQLVGELVGGGGVQEQEEQRRQEEVILKYLNSVLHSGAVGAAAALALDGVRGGAGNGDAFESCYRATNVAEKDIARYVEYMCHVSSAGTLWYSVLNGLCSSGNVVSSELATKVYGLCSEAPLNGQSQAYAAFIGAVRNIRGSVLTALFIACTNVGVLEAVAQARPLKLCSSYRAVANRWISGELDPHSARGFRLIAHIGKLFNRDSDEDMAVVKAIMQLCAVELKEQTASVLHVEDTEVSCSVSNTYEMGEVGEDDWVISDEGDMIVSDEDTVIISNEIEAANIAVSVMDALSSLPLEDLNEMVQEAITALPEILLVRLRPHLLSLSAKYTKLLDYVIATFGEVDPLALHLLTPEQVAAVAVSSEHPDHAFLTLRSDPQLCALHGAIIGQTASHKPIDTELLQQWQNRREASKQYLDATLQLLTTMLSQDVVSLKDHQWCIDTLAWIGQEFPFYRKPVLQLLIPMLKPPKRFVKIIQVGNMKQKEDGSTYIRASVVSTLCGWLRDERSTWDYSDIRNLAYYLRYPLRDLPLKRLTLQLMHTIIDRFGGFLALRDYPTIHETLQLIQNKYPEDTEGIAAHFHGIVNSI
ncbi:uncharacterized protein Ecym_1340 [Eremothecium cymbalariae DBVPG|uniref:TATA-binding protein interacting (TIP20) domain-containing protein n=1 Tax=Eremothecium cymbalariae (strain CBS 270.75 / DBVPG 7215 / KCTC 17166 / NRRL Y-17582) TaxID=931890 RepID=G8JNB0_ERECY|nr:hypothetical protein Ecym_1340 [Eremothecium cymbalariae DBVPG\